MEVKLEAGVMNRRDQRTILVTGATGYIGGRLVPRLLEAGYRVRCLARSPKKLDNRPWTDHPAVDIVAGDVGDPEGLARAMSGCAIAYYLVHSMVAVGSSYAERDRELAHNFAAAAEAAGCERIIYLGGLGETGVGLSEHLSSRREVERTLGKGSVPVTVLRAAMIIGSGSASFEILRYLVERLPIMVTPRWVSTECQPIAVDNVLHYLIEAMEHREVVGRTLDIGGPEVGTYRELMQTYAAAAGLRRRIIVPVPVLTPWLSSLWIHLVTPLDAQIARPLAEGLRNRVVCRDDQAARLMPQVLLSTRQAIDAALGMDHPETWWSDAGTIPGDPDWAGGTSYLHREETDVDAAAVDVFRTVVGIGGRNGWYGVDSLWRLRGWIDQLLGGPGLRRGRRDAESVRYGDALDFWRVTGIEEGTKLQLRAEMILPGEAILEFEIEPGETVDGCRLIQTARFLPRGLAGILYWYAVMPLHGVVFRRMLQGIRRAAERGAKESLAAEAAQPTAAQRARK
jgi:uncharacterized protein YbjT (DUF2867 family)